MTGDMRILAPAAIWLLVMAGPAHPAGPAKAAQPARTTPVAESPLARAQSLLDSGDAEAALKLLEGQGANSKNAQVWLLRSTAHFLLGERELGVQELDRALALDPKLRQGWLNRAALAVAEQRYDDALAAFGSAEKLDPESADNHLNIGVVLLFKKQLPEAASRFRRFLDAEGSAEASYLVAMNYAIAAQPSLAVEHLRKAIALDERMRRRARADESFLGIAADAGYQRLLTESPRRPAEDDYIASQVFEVPYQGAQGRLLPAVLDALQLEGERFDNNVEVSPTWALIWGDLRIEVRSEGDGGLVEISAPGSSVSLSDFQRRTEALFRRIQARLLKGST